MSTPPSPPMSGTHSGMMVQNGDYNFVGTPPISTWLVVLNVVTTITHLLLGAVAFIAIAFASHYNISSSLTQHICLCVLGYIILMSEAIFSVSPYSGWAHTLKYQQKKVIHSIMQILGAILAIAGSVIRIAGASSHFQSPHGYLGIIAMILTILSLIGGVANFYSAKLRRFGIKPVIHKISHSCLGSVTLILAFLCLIFGFDKAIFKTISGTAASALAIALTVLALVGTLFSAVVEMFKRLFNC